MSTRGHLLVSAVASVALMVGSLVACAGGSAPTDQQRLGTAAASPSGDPTSEETSNETSAGVDVADVTELVDYAERLAPHYDLSVPGGIVLVSTNGATDSFAFGDAQLRPSRPMTTGARFPIGSVTKPMVATVVLQLVDERVLGLDDTVERWVPGLLASGARTTVEDLLSHRSGIDDVVAATHPPFDIATDLTDDRLRELLDHPLTDPPGTVTRYSNPNYWILGRIIEAATGHSVARELERRIFDSAGMATADLSTDLAHEPRLVHGYDQQDRDITPGDISAAWTAGGVVATAGDIAAFYDALFSGRLLPTQEVDDMTTSRGTMPDGNVDYGLGTFILDLDCGEAVGHEGWLDGFHTMALHDPATGRTVVTFTNTTSPSGQDAAPDLAIRTLCYS